jgi:hypothetical protein
MQRQWVTDRVSFTLDDETLTIRDRVGETPWQSLIRILLFAVVAVVGAGYVYDLAHSVTTGGLLEQGKTGLSGDATALSKLALILGVIGAVVLAWARPVFGGHEVLQLTKDTVTLINVDFGVKWRRRQFQRRAVTGVEYAAVQSTDTSDIYAIRFRVERRQIKVFRYIEPNAADEVIQALQSF